MAKPLTEYVEPKFLEFYMNTSFVDKFSRQNANGTGRLTLPLEVSRLLPVPLVSLPEQRAIVAKIEELFSDVDKGIADRGRQGQPSSEYVGKY